MLNEIEFESRLSQSNRYYDMFACEVRNRTEKRSYSKAFELFLKRVSSEGQIVDVGCGTGEHLKHFVQNGFNAIGVEPSAEMRKIAETNKLKVIDGAFETLSMLSLGTVSGVWCAASLLHVPSKDLKNTFDAIYKMLNKNAPMFLTVRLGDGSKWDQYDGKELNVRRFIQLFSKEEVIDRLILCGYKVVEQWTEDSTWGRPAKWLSVIAIKESGS